MPVFLKEDSEELRARLELIMLDALSILTQATHLVELAQTRQGNALSQTDKEGLALYIDGIYKLDEMCQNVEAIVSALGQLSQLIGDQATYLETHNQLGTRGNAPDPAVVWEILDQYRDDSDPYAQLAAHIAHKPKPTVENRAADKLAVLLANAGTLSKKGKTSEN